MNENTEPRYKLQLRDDDGIWSDLMDSDGSLEIFASEKEARRALESRYGMRVRLEQYSGAKTTRIINIDAYADKDED